MSNTTTASTTSKLFIYRWHEPQPHYSYIFELIAFLFITLVLPFWVHRICCRLRNQQHNAEEIELGYIGVGRVNMDLFSISIISSDVTDSICAICTCAFANGDQIITLPFVDTSIIMSVLHLILHLILLGVRCVAMIMVIIV